MKQATSESLPAWVPQGSEDPVYRKGRSTAIGVLPDAAKVPSQTVLHLQHTLSIWALSSRGGVGY